MEPRRSSPTSPSATTSFSAFADATTFRASAAGPARRRRHPARRLWRGHRPADLLRSLRLLPGLVRRQSGPEARDARAAGRPGSAGANGAVQPRRHLVSRRGCGTRSSTRSIPPPSSPAPPMPTGASRRDGIELGAAWRHADWLNLEANYTWLDAERAARRRRGAGARGPPAAQQRQPCRLGRGRPLPLGREPRLCRRAAGHGFRPVPGGDRDRLDDYLLASLRIGYRILPQLELYRAGGECVRRRLSGRGRLQHARTDGLCGSSRRFWPISLRARRGARPTPRRGGWRRSTCAPTSWC